ncbi:site-specific recombinase [Marivirga sp. S37H4]|uniref:Site-specific recombinase n=1 Tax=Marivirga aurantiaca TaxID=2802615 RepID=A0A934WXA0_9BACT|nr:site-specific recombinase [Marivirga aurantiaca]MBK6264818.1 site-specific recombinase [Marivirga aurantiaca]
MIELLQKINTKEPVTTDILVELINQIRPPKNKPEIATENFAKLREVLKQNPSKAEQLRNYLTKLICSKQSIQLFTESGILSNKGFFRELRHRVNSHFLPEVYNETDHTATFNEMFHKNWDYQWVNTIPDEEWSGLFQDLGLRSISHLDKENSMLIQLLNSILVLSQRVAALGLEPEILTKLPELEEFDSPFMVQNKEIFDYVENFQKEGFDKTDQNPDYKHIMVMLNQCEDYISLIRKNKRKFGADLHLTYLLLRLNQNIERLRKLLKLIDVSSDPIPFSTEIEVFKTLVITENKKNSLSEHFENNLSLLAFQVTEHSGKTGDHYITNTRLEWWKMLLSAMGGGLIVGVLTIIKVLIYYLRLAPFGEAFLYSMNYSLGFIGIHLTHSTLATKQPAMTASRLAASLDVSDQPKNEALDNLADLIVKISRSQFIAFVGNVVIAFPVAFGIALAFHYFSGSHIAEPEKALKLIHELNPWESYAIFHAAITGIFLFLSGLISGYYDNKNVYHKIHTRLRKHTVLIRIFGRRNTERFGGYIENNLGSLAGNFFLGIFLGTTGTIGFILGLPLDIRHITFSSGNFGIAVASIGAELSQYQIWMSISGILLIGLVNFYVSFSLATFVAIKSRKVNFKQTRKLISLIFKLFFKAPHHFFLPPKDVVEKIKDEAEVTTDKEDVKGKKEEENTHPEENNEENNSSSEEGKVRPVKK